VRLKSSKDLSAFRAHFGYNYHEELFYDNTGGVMNQRRPLNPDCEGILLWTRNNALPASGFAGVPRFSDTCKTAVVSKLQHF
jgi:hypothetical protein